MFDKADLSAELFSFYTVKCLTKQIFLLNCFVYFKMFDKADLSAEHLHCVTKWPFSRPQQTSKKR